MTSPRAFFPAFRLSLTSALVLATVSCHHDIPSYRAGVLALAAGFSAKEVCSCVFVMGRDASFCREFTRVSPDVARFSIDYEKKEVRARALGLARTVARYTGPSTGCRLTGEP
jgi:hypothetical protein